MCADSFSRLSFELFTQMSWPCRVCRISNDYVLLEMRESVDGRSRYQLASCFTKLCHVKTFYRRISDAYRVVFQFWIDQVVNDTQRLCLTPVSRKVMICASWVFRMDLSAQGARYLRTLLGDFFGYYSLSEMTVPEICSCMSERVIPCLRFQHE